MNRSFVMTPDFDRSWSSIGLGDDELAQLQQRLIEDPETGDTISDTAGARKIRIALENSGKGRRGGARVIYVDVVVREKIYLLLAYQKSEQDDLTPRQKKQVKNAVLKIKGE